MTDPNQHVDPVNAETVDGRLGQIIRRHRGRVKPMPEPSAMKLPTPKRGISKDQLTIGDIDARD